MAFNPHNPLVNLYAGEASITIEKNVKVFGGDPLALEQAYLSLIKVYEKADKRGKALDLEIATLKKDKTDLLAQLVKERGEWAVEKGKDNTDIAKTQSFLDQALVREQGWTTFNKEIMDSLQGGTPSTGRYIKRVSDIQYWLPKHADGTYYTLPEMSEEITTLRLGMKGIYGVLGSTDIAGIPDIEKYLTMPITGRKMTLKELYDSRCSLQKFCNDVGVKTTKTTAADMLAEIDALINIRIQWNNLKISNNTARVIMDTIEALIAKKNTKITSTKFLGTVRNTIKPQVETQFKSLRNTLNWGMGIAWEDE